MRLFHRQIDLLNENIVLFDLKKVHCLFDFFNVMLIFVKFPFVQLNTSYFIYIYSKTFDQINNKSKIIFKAEETRSDSDQTPT